ncbi:MAG: alpha/beta fold hydrolase, partial [Gammaproteobacteria bacterium]|nr:alpha/beta fold hydrolase [Gammaproteobacteria bacterium]
QFIKQIEKTQYDGNLFMLSHSMGGAIGLRYIQQHPETFEKVAFSSPMWALNAGPVPKPIAKGLLKIVAWSTSLWSDQSPYFFGGQDYNPVPFAENVLTHSNVRYIYFRDTYDQTPELQLGSVTINWIQESVAALDIAYEQLNMVKSPVLVLQSGAEKVIDNEGQNRFCQRLKDSGNPCVSGTPIVIENAQHELFIEEDKKRSEALKHIIGFFSS